MKKIVLIITLLVVFFSGLLHADVKNNKNSSAVYLSNGVSMGDIEYSKLNVLLRTPDAIVGEAGSLSIVQKTKGYYDYILNKNVYTLKEAIGYAEKYCKENIKEGIVYYGVANFRFDFQITNDNGVVYLASYDVYCARPK